MAISTHAGDDALLRKPSDDQSPPPTLNRHNAEYLPLRTYHLPRAGGKHYQQQYADMYFARLAQLKPALETIAADAYAEFSIAGEKARRVDRVLDVRQGELVWVIGTVYMEMPLKPNVLEDIGREHWIAAPPPREKYVTDGEAVQMMLEDESGRLRLTGGYLHTSLLVTGAIVAVLGTENRDGDFEVLDVRVPDLPRQPPRWEDEESAAALRPTKKRKLEKSEDNGKLGKLAIVSGLSISGDTGDTLSLDLLLEWLLGEATSAEGQAQAATISRLVIAGNSLDHAAPIPTRDDVVAAKKGGRKTYGYDASAYNAAPTSRLDTWIANLLPSLPVTLIPGVTDPTSTALPQQPIHAAMFPHSRTYTDPSSSEPDWFDSTTNPAEFSVAGWRMLATGGQPVDDVYKYVSGEERLDLMEAMLRWRLTAPTAPDTLFCFPFQDEDKFVLKDCPYVFIVGNQPRFESRVIQGPQGQTTRLIAVPKFRETGEVVLLDMETLDVELVKIELFGEGEEAGRMDAD